MNRPGSALSKIHWKRKLGDSNPRYGNPYGSLANCWFQPLTQTSSAPFSGLPKSIFAQMRVQRYKENMNPANFFCNYFRFTQKNVVKAVPVPLFMIRIKIGCHSPEPIGILFSQSEWKNKLLFLVYHLQYQS